MWMEGGEKWEVKRDGEGEGERRGEREITEQMNDLLTLGYY